MSLGTTLLLGLIAGVTILLGMPLGRLRGRRPVLQLFLNAIAIGVLLFLVWDVLSGAWEPLDARLAAVHDDTGGLGPVLGYGALFVAGLSAGLLGLVGYDRYLQTRARRARRMGPGSASVHEGRGLGIGAWSPARQLALLI